MPAITCRGTKIFRMAATRLYSRAPVTESSMMTAKRESTSKALSLATARWPSPVFASEDEIAGGCNGYSATEASAVDDADHWLGTVSS